MGDSSKKRDRDEDGGKKEKKEKKDKKDKKDKRESASPKRSKRDDDVDASGAAAADDGAPTTVKVTGLVATITGDKIADHFGVDVYDVGVQTNGEAFVTLPSRAAAARAVRELNETRLVGRFIVVSEHVEEPPEAPPAFAPTPTPRTEQRRGGLRHGGGEAVMVECAGQTGRIIGRGGAKIKEIEDLTGCVLRIHKERGVCEVTGRDVMAAVQEIKNIVAEGRERDDGGLSGRDEHLRGGTKNDGGGRGVFDARDETPRWDETQTPRFDAPAPARAAPPRADPSVDPVTAPFGKPPPRSASRHDTGANDWHCACGSTNFARRTTCFGCGAPRGDDARPAAAAAAAAAPRPGQSTSEGANTLRALLSSIPSIPSALGATTGAGAPAGAPAAVKAPTQGTDGDGYEVFVKYLPHDCEARDVASFFESKFGPLKDDVRLLINPATGQCKGAGFVSFQTEPARAAAIAADGIRFGGRHLSITAAKTGTYGVRGTDQAHGTHTPAMLRETIDALVAPNRDGVYVDGTFGRGGHSRGILAALSNRGRLHAFDMDPEAIAEAKKLEAEDARFTIHHAPFGCMDTVLKPKGVVVAGVFLDLGISSPQFDDASRGFRPEQDGPLDLRFDVTRGIPASEYLRRVERDELARVIETYGETADATAARRVADAVCLARETGEGVPSTTKAFASLVARAKGQEYQAMHPAKLTFQALRIELNQEFDEMRRGMRAAVEVMEDGGRLGVLTWKHSECAILVDFFRHVEETRPDLPLARFLEDRHPSVAAEVALANSDGWALTADDAKRPSEKETRENSRSRSAILHVLRKRCRASRVVDVERAAYPLLGWGKPPEPPPPPPVTFAYADANVTPGKEKKDKKDKKDKKEKKRGSKWAEA